MRLSKTNEENRRSTKSRFSKGLGKQTSSAVLGRDKETLEELKLLPSNFNYRAIAARNASGSHHSVSDISSGLTTPCKDPTVAAGTLKDGWVPEMSEGSPKRRPTALSDWIYYKYCGSAASILFGTAISPISGPSRRRYIYGGEIHLVLLSASPFTTQHKILRFTIGFAVLNSLRKIWSHPYLRAQSIRGPLRRTSVDCYNHSVFGTLQRLHPLLIKGEVCRFRICAGAFLVGPGVQKHFTSGQTSVIQGWLAGAAAENGKYYFEWMVIIRVPALTGRPMQERWLKPMGTWLGLSPSRPMNGGEETLDAGWWVAVKRFSVKRRVVVQVGRAVSQRDIHTKVVGIRDDYMELTPRQLAAGTSRYTSQYQSQTVAQLGRAV
ncbi:hypothetical protein B0H13DRAFT_1853110 [Mycena leptocephala]|nr:hypothetical protein B0H13DRAFT_1853110 [Mycena leptocephala]